VLTAAIFLLALLRRILAETWAIPSVGIVTGDGRALLSYQGVVSYSRWAFRLKDWIDRRFLARFS
jgi:hypothetical protein